MYILHTSPPFFSDKQKFYLLTTYTIKGQDINILVLLYNVNILQMLQNKKKKS